MRIVALLLILCNVLYFAWAKWIDVTPLPPLDSQAEQSDASTLVLASERPPQSQEKSANQPATPSTFASGQTSAATVAAVNGQSCISVGPFQDLPSATQAAATLHSASFDSRQRLEQGELWVGYWLSVQTLRTREAADRAIVSLKEHGITDAYVIPGSDPPNIVSLGVFKEQERAQRLMDEVRKLGFDAQISDRTRSGSVYWLDVTLGEPDKRFDLSLLGAEPGKILRLELRPCLPSGTGDNG